jgi:hypothetical protein
MSFDCLPELHNKALVAVLGRAPMVCRSRQHWQRELVPGVRGRTANNARRDSADCRIPWRELSFQALSERHDETSLAMPTGARMERYSVSDQTRALVPILRPNPFTHIA